MGFSGALVKGGVGAPAPAPGPPHGSLTLPATWLRPKAGVARRPQPKPRNGIQPPERIQNRRIVFLALMGILVRDGRGY